MRPIIVDMASKKCHRYRNRKTLYKYCTWVRHFVYLTYYISNCFKEVRKECRSILVWVKMDCEKVFVFGNGMLGEREIVDDNFFGICFLFGDKFTFLKFKLIKKIHCTKY